MRVGLELELLAPQGQTRVDVANAIAARVGGAVRFGFKHTVDGEISPGKPRCRLSLSCRVLDADSRWLCDVVDDTTLHDGLPPADGTPASTAPLLICDDTRIAKWLEARAASTSPDLHARLAPVLSTFDATLEDGGRVTDPWGQVLAVVAATPAATLRVCELVTRPLTDDLEPTVHLLLAAAAGCTVPEAAALHLHVDAAPFQSTALLAALITRFSVDRDHLMARLKPNPRCKRLGPQPEAVVRVAREAPPDMPFHTFAAALKLAGAHKGCDLNILGAIEPFPPQPTVELRCLPMGLDAATVLASVRLGMEAVVIHQ